MPGHCNEPWGKPEVNYLLLKDACYKAVTMQITLMTEKSGVLFGPTILKNYFVVWTGV